ncbi:hypothetical protein IGI04_042291, partial [Brassica rapa subsp. trilocularis]
QPSPGRYRPLHSDRTSDPLGRLLRSDRARAKARSLRSDRALIPLGRYVATGLEPKLGRYVATELKPKLGRYRPAIVPSVAYVSDRASSRSRSPRSGRAIVQLVSLSSDRALARARSLRSDRAGRALGRYVATALWLELGRYVATDRVGRTFGRYVAADIGPAWYGFLDDNSSNHGIYSCLYFLLDTYSHKCVTDMICQYFLAAARRKNYSGAELEGVVKSATSYALNRQLSMDDLTKPVEEKNIKITMEDFLHAIHEVQPAFGASTDDLERCRYARTLLLWSMHLSLFNCIATIDNVVWDSRCNEETFHFLRKSFRLNTSDFYSNQSPRTVPLPELGRPYAAELQARCLQPSPLQSLLWSHHDKESCGKRFSMSDMRKPDSWKLNEIFATGIVLGGYQAVMSVIFFWVIHKTDFCSDKFGVRSIRDNNDELMFAVYLQVSIISQALIFVTRSRSWSFVERPGALLMIAFVIAQLIATLIAVYANWTFAKVKGIGWGWAAVIWVYSILTYIPQDILKFAIRYILSGKAWVSMFDKRHSALTTRRDYGAGERQADWAREQRTQHGLQTRQEVNVFPENEGYKELSQIVEQAKKRAEIARLREIHTFKGHVESVVKLKGMDIDTSGHHYTL